VLRNAVLFFRYSLGPGGASGAAGGSMNMATAGTGMPPGIHATSSVKNTKTSSYPEAGQAACQHLSSFGHSDLK